MAGRLIVLSAVAFFVTTACSTFGLFLDHWAVADFGNNKSFTCGLFVCNALTPDDSVYDWIAWDQIVLSSKALSVLQGTRAFLYLGLVFSATTLLTGLVVTPLWIIACCQKASRTDLASIVVTAVFFWAAMLSWGCNFILFLVAVDNADEFKFCFTSYLSQFGQSIGVPVNATVENSELGGCVVNAGFWACFSVVCQFGVTVRYCGDSEKPIDGVNRYCCEVANPWCTKLRLPEKDVLKQIGCCCQAFATCFAAPVWAFSKCVKPIAQSIKCCDGNCKCWESPNSVEPDTDEESMRREKEERDERKRQKKEREKKARKEMEELEREKSSLKDRLVRQLTATCSNHRQEALGELEIKIPDSGKRRAAIEVRERQLLAFIHEAVTTEVNRLEQVNHIRDEYYGILEKVERNLTERYGENWFGNLNPDSGFLCEIL